MHLGLILDGNRRWAKQQGKLAGFGHQAGFDNFICITKHCAGLEQIKTISAYVLSTENLKRSKFELDNLFSIFINLATKHTAELKQNGVKVRLVGNLELLPDKVRLALENMAAETADNKKLLLQICIAYGGQDEIVRAVNKVGVKNLLPCSLEDFSKEIDSALGGKIDLVIRTGGKKRLSNFMLWQSAYAELYFSEKMWPEFGVEDLDKALKFFFKQQRNFGE